MLPANYFDVFDVSEWRVVLDEAAGAEEKLWLKSPQEEDWLFKPVVQHETEMLGRWSQHEDWSEKISSELGHELGIPCAHVELAIMDGRRGCISKDIRPENWELQPGSALLSERDPSYASQAPGRVGHSLASICNALADCGVPPGSDLPTEFSGYDVFARYLMFDALIANQDRHEENWSILMPPAPARERFLAHSYDHGSTLGFNLRDERCEMYCAQQSIESWARKGVARRFEALEGAGPLDLVSFSSEAFSFTNPQVKGYWMSRLRDIDDSSIPELIERIPGMSQPVRTFTTEVLLINQRRLLNEC